MPEDAMPKEAPIADLMPEAWRGGWVRVSSYRMYLLSLEQLRGGLVADVQGVRARFFWGGAPYFDHVFRFRAEPDGTAVAELKVNEVRHADDGPYLLLMTQWKPSGTGDDGDAIARVREVVALLRLALGPNVAVDHLGDLTVRPSTNEVQGTSPAFVLPDWYGAPDISREALHLVGELDGALNQLDQVQRNRVHLSLQWLYKAQAAHGVDGFLMHWFTLEALAMPDTTNVSALNGAISRAYGISTDVAGQRFRLGRISDLRGRIVHDGVQPPIHSRLNDYLAAVYWDVLLDKVGLEHRGAAERVLAADPARAWLP